MPDAPELIPEPVVDGVVEELDEGVEEEELEDGEVDEELLDCADNASGRAATTARKVR